MAAEFDAQSLDLHLLLMQMLRMHVHTHIPFPAFSCYHFLLLLFYLHAHVSFVCLCVCRSFVCLQTVTQMSINNKYKEALLAQIQANDEKRRKERQEHLQEGGRIRVEAAKEQQLLREIKAEKLVELHANGVPAKYRAELEKMKILN